MSCSGCEKRRQELAKLFRIHPYRYFHNPVYFINHKHKFIWPCITKNASHSIIEALPQTSWHRADKINGLNYFTFAVIRHPWERLLSYYHPAFWKDFKDFVKKAVLDKHNILTLPQSSFLGNIKTDKLIKFDNLENEWPGIMDKTGAKILPHLNASELKKPWEVLDFDWDKLMPKYGKDFELFNQVQ